MWNLGAPLGLGIYPGDLVSYVPTSMVGYVKFSFSQVYVELITLQ